MRRGFVIVLLSLIVNMVFAQEKEQRIFLWDVSGSLISNKMWDPLKEQLIEGIINIENDPQNKIVLVKFYSGIMDIQTVYATEKGKKRLVDYIKDTRYSDNQYLNFYNKTNIVLAIQMFKKLVKTDYINYMFLYTDGKNEIGSLRDELNNWPRNNGDTKCYGFYVLVHHDAQNDDIKDAEKKYDNFWVVNDSKVSIKLCNINQPISYNNREERGKEIKIRLTGNLKTFKGGFKLVSNDPYYTLSVVKKEIPSGNVTIMIMPKPNTTIPEKHKMSVKAYTEGKDPYSFITPKSFEILCINKPERILRISIQ